MTVPAKLLYESIAARIASDPAVLGLTTFLQVAPILANYTPDVTLEKSSLTLGTGTLAPLDATAITESGLDAVTGQFKILVPPPSGGWTWNYDGVSPAPPQSIFGFALLDASTGDDLFAVTDRLPTPILLTVASLVVFDEMSMLLLRPPLQ
jgi:hypothetical protein